VEVGDVRTLLSVKEKEVRRANADLEVTKRELDIIVDKLNQRIKNNRQLEYKIFNLELRALGIQHDGVSCEETRNANEKMEGGLVEENEPPPILPSYTEEESKKVQEITEVNKFLIEEAQQLKRFIEERDVKINLFTKQCNNLNCIVRCLGDKNEKLVHQIAEKEEELRSLILKMNGMKNEMKTKQEFEDFKEQLTSEYNKKLLNLENAKNLEIKDKGAEMHQMMCQMQRLRNEYAAISNSDYSYKQAVAQLAERLKGTHGTIREKDVIIARLQMENQAIQKRGSVEEELQRKIKLLLEQEAALKNELAIKCALLKKVLVEKAELASKNEILNRDLMASSNRLKSIEQAAAALSRQKWNLEIKLKSLSAEIFTLRQQIRLKQNPRWTSECLHESSISPC